VNVLALIHHEVAGSGVFAAEVRRRGHDLHEWQPSLEPLPEPLEDYDAVIAFGGGMQVDQHDRFPWLRTALDVLREATEREIPTLGVCLGAQALVAAAGGAVGPSPEVECGWREVELTQDGETDPLLGEWPRAFEVFQWHSYAFELPPGATALARNEVCLQAFRLKDCAWGVQWHPEVTAETILLWARRYIPSLNGVPATIDLPSLEADVERRISAANDEGRALCGRFLEVAMGARRRAAYGRSRTT
jgi:GMP synthase (glutamine-hydrolysing)